MIGDWWRNKKGDGNGDEDGDGNGNGGTGEGSHRGSVNGRKVRRIQLLLTWYRVFVYS